MVDVRPLSERPPLERPHPDRRRQTRLGYESDFPLMSDREYPHFVPRDYEPVQRDVPRLAERDHELPNVAVHAATNQWMCGQALDGRTDAPGSRDCRVQVLACQELEGALAIYV